MKWNINTMYKKEPKKPDFLSPRHSSGTGIQVPLIVLGCVLILVIAIPLMQKMSQPLQYNFAPQSYDPQARATDYAYRLSVASGQMTNAAGTQWSAVTQQAQATQAVYQAQVNATQQAWAQQQAVESTRVAATNWSYTQTPLAATQIALDIRLDRLKREAYYGQFVSPLKVLGGAAFLGVCMILMLVGAIHAYRSTLPIYQARMQVVKEDRGERTIIVRPGQVINTAQMFDPVLTEQPDGSIVASGGAPDPNLQLRRVHDSDQVKMMQALPLGTRLPSPRPDMTGRALPELEIVDADVKDIKPQLLADIRQSLDGEEGSA